MKYRVILLVPEGLTFDMLTPEQQTAIQSVFGEYVLPMPSTIPYNGTVVCDALAADNFDPSTLGPLGLPFEIIGLWKEDGEAVVPFNKQEFLAHLPDQIIYDDNGTAIGSTPAVLHETHTWGGRGRVMS